MRDFLDPVKLPDVVQRIKRRRQPSVHADNLVFDDSSEWKIIESVRELLPHLRAAVRPHRLSKNPYT